MRKRCQRQQTASRSPSPLASASTIEILEMKIAELQGENDKMKSLQTAEAETDGEGNQAAEVDREKGFLVSFIEHFQLTAKTPEELSQDTSLQGLNSCDESEFTETLKLMRKKSWSGYSEVCKALGIGTAQRDDGDHVQELGHVIFCVAVGVAVVTRSVPNPFNWYR